MTLIRKDQTYRLTELPTLKTGRFMFNGQIGHTGSLIRRPVKNSGGIYKHTGLIYGYGHDDTLWIIENNVNGVECISFRDFHLGMGYKIQLNPNPLMVGVILARAHERSNEKYNARDNNCETFTTYCLTGILESQQTKNTEAFADIFLTISEFYLAIYTEGTTLVDNSTELRKHLRIPRPEPVDNAIKKIIKKKNELRSGTKSKIKSKRAATVKKTGNKKTKGEKN